MVREAVETVIEKAERFNHRRFSLQSFLCVHGAVWASDFTGIPHCSHERNKLNRQIVKGEKYTRAERKSQNSDREEGVVWKEMTRANLRAGQLRWKPLFNWQMTEVSFSCLCVSVVRLLRGSGISELRGPAGAGPRPSLPHPWWDTEGQADTNYWLAKKNNQNSQNTQLVEKTWRPPRLLVLYPNKPRSDKLKWRDIFQKTNQRIE